MDLSLIQGTIAGLKTASDIAKGFLDLKTMTDVQGKVIELQSAILAAQSSALSANADQAAMAEEIRSLKAELERVKAWERQKERYQMHAPWEGATVYALKESQKGTDPAHWICTQCYELGKRSILQHHARTGGWASYVCGVCRSEVQSPWRSAVAFEYAKE